MERAHTLFRRGLVRALDETSDLEVVAEAAGGVEAVETASALAPDVILMDVRMPSVDGIDATRLLVDAIPTTRILMLSGSDAGGELLEAKAAARGLPLHKVMVPTQCSNADYEAKMGAAIAALLEQGVAAMGFGDLFLEDIRAYRERMLAPTGMQPLFPIWGEPTAALARAIVAAGFRATLCCVDPRALAPEFAGRSYDASLLEDLPAGVDPCAGSACCALRALGVRGWRTRGRRVGRAHRGGVLYRARPVASVEIPARDASVREFRRIGSIEARPHRAAGRTDAYPRRGGPRPR